MPCTAASPVATRRLAIHISAEYTSSANSATPEVDMPENSARVVSFTVRR